MTLKIITTREPLLFRQALAMLANINVSYGLVSEETIITVVKKPYNKPVPPVEEICETITQMNVKSLTNDLKRSIRQDRKGERRKKEKMKSWSAVQRRGFLKGKLRYQKGKLTLKEEYQRYYAEFQGAELEFPAGERGPTQRYDRIGLCAGIALKMRYGIQWMKLPTRLRGEGIDIRVEEKQTSDYSPVPSHQLFFRLFKKVDADQLKKVLKETDEKSQAELEIWKGEPIPRVYAADGSGHPLQDEEPCVIRKKETFRRISTHLVLLQNLLTLTVRDLFYSELEGISRRDIRAFIADLPPGTKLLLDREFDVEYLQVAAKEAEVDLQARPNLKEGKVAASPLRREAHENFDKVLYRHRKIVEAIFAILASRGVLIPVRVTIAMAAKATLWACVGHNCDQLISLEIYLEFFQWIEWPEHKEQSQQFERGVISELSLATTPDTTLSPPIIPPKQLTSALQPDIAEVSKTTLTSRVSASKSVDPRVTSSRNAIGRQNPVVSQPQKATAKQYQEIPFFRKNSIAQLLFNFLLLHSPHGQDRSQICQALELPRTTVYDNLQRMIRKGVVRTSLQSTGDIGRPRVIFTLCTPASDRGPPIS